MCETTNSAFPILLPANLCIFVVSIFMVHYGNLKIILRRQMLVSYLTKTMLTLQSNVHFGSLGSNQIGLMSVETLLFMLLCNTANTS